MRVFVLGHNGMLGHVVARYFKETGHLVATTHVRHDAANPSPLLDMIDKANVDAVINCIGKIKQKSTDAGELFLTNAVLPIQLLSRLSFRQKLVQVSSDCVFSGKKGNYSPLAQPDPIDAYGESKLAGEIVGTDYRSILIRTSIIGPELVTSSGLFSWFCNNLQKQVSGFTNHTWNGVTTLELAKKIEQLLQLWIANKSVGTGPIHIPSSEPVSKYRLLTAINELWSVRKTIVSENDSEEIDRTLLPSFGIPGIEFGTRSIEQQLLELKEWY